MGQAYQQGVGVTKDMIHARYWLERADATESAQEAKDRPVPAEREPDVARKVVGRLSAGCRPNTAPTYAMYKNNVTEVIGFILFYVDSEGRVRGVTARNVSVDALKYDVVALFSASLRSPKCEITQVEREITRDVKIEIPFKFVVH